MLAANTFAGAVFAIIKSASGVTVVNTGGVMLFVGFGSPVGEPTVAMFVNVPLAGAVTVNDTLLTAPFTKLPRLQITTPELFTPPPLAPTKLAPFGIASVTVTLLAVDGPKFDTEIV